MKINLEISVLSIEVDSVALYINFFDDDGLPIVDDAGYPLFSPNHVVLKRNDKMVLTDFTKTEEYKW